MAKRSTRTRMKERLAQALASIERAGELYAESIVPVFEFHPEKQELYETVIEGLQMSVNLMQMSHEDI